MFGDRVNLGVPNLKGSLKGLFTKDIVLGGRGSKSLNFVWKTN
jgi:hypothetical protein